MHGDDASNENSTTSIKFAAAQGTKAEIGFEPIGTTFEVAPGDWVTLQLPTAAVAGVEIVVWPNGVAVWVPFPGDYVVLDSTGNELDRL